MIKCQYSYQCKNTRAINKVRNVPIDFNEYQKFPFPFWLHTLSSKPWNWPCNEDVSKAWAGAGRPNELTFDSKIELN